MMDSSRLCLLVVASFIIVWQKYHLCVFPLRTWMMVDYAAVFVSLLLKFVDKFLTAAIGLDIGRQQRNSRFYGRIIVFSSQLLFPFLWAWTIIGTVRYIRARNCLPEEDAKWSILYWLLLSYSGLVSFACSSILKWLTIMELHQLREELGIPDTKYGREAAEVLVRELPKFRLKVVLTDCSECSICLEEFQVGNEVRGLPCAPNFHVECIDKWLRLNVKCPICRCCVFLNLDLSARSNIQRFWEAIF